MNKILNMPSEREKMEDWSLGQVADSLAGAGLGSSAHIRATAEMFRRQTIAQKKAYYFKQRFKLCSASRLFCGALN